MLTALIIAATLTALTLAALAVILTGWFPRLAALSVRALEPIVCAGPTRLDPRERAELIARLWVPI